MKLRLLVPLLAALLLTACKQTPTSTAPAIVDQHATVIAMDEAGQLIDFVHITPESDIIRIEFLAPKDGSNTENTVSFLKFVLSDPMDTYCFAQVDPAHPDNQHLVEAGESLPVQWTLKIFFAGSGINRSANLHVGQHNGRLMFTN